MSHHHHHHHHHRRQPPLPAPCCCTCINTSSCCPSSNSNCCCFSNSTPNPISPSSSTSDLILHTLLLLQPQPQPQPDRTPRHRLHPHPKHHNRHDDHDADPSLNLHLLLHSLTRRVAALESSLSNISSSSPPPPPQKEPQQQPLQSPLKHAAAATIQRCFRRLLARRSRTLRDLKHLASIKSHAAALRSSLHDTKHPKALSHRAMDLLFQLDSIQSSDPMIREGKRSVSKELVRISEFVDKVLLIREEKKEDEVEEMERTLDRARRVRFEEEENGVGDHNVFDELLDRNPEEAAGEEEEAQGFYGPVVKNDRFANGGSRTLNGGLGLAAPLPVKMEPRRPASIKKVANEED